MATAAWKDHAGTVWRLIKGHPGYAAPTFVLLIAKPLLMLLGNASKWAAEPGSTLIAIVVGVLAIGWFLFFAVVADRNRQAEGEQRQAEANTQQLEAYRRIADELLRRQHELIVRPAKAMFLQAQVHALADRLDIEAREFLRIQQMAEAVRADQRDQQWQVEREIERSLHFWRNNESRINEVMEAAGMGRMQIVAPSGDDATRALPGNLQLTQGLRAEYAMALARRLLYRTIAERNLAYLKERANGIGYGPIALEPAPPLDAAG